jgi:hypothetical protein
LLLQLQILSCFQQILQYVDILHTQNKFSIDLQNPTQKKTNKQTTKKPSLKTQKQKLKQMTKVEAVIFFLVRGVGGEKKSLSCNLAMQCNAHSLPKQCLLKQEEARSSS